MTGLIRNRRSSIAGVVLLAIIAASSHAQTPAHPNVRAITAFVRLDPATLDRQIADALTVLRAAEAEFTRRGYQTQTIRIGTQPLGEMVIGRSDDEALRLLEKALSTLPNIQGNSIIAAEDGIHWNVIRESAALVRYLTDHAPPSHGNFNFTAAAMVQPYGPFYPGTYHTGDGKRFSIGFESANVVQEVFARTHGHFEESVSELTRQLTIHAKATGAKFGSSGTLTAALVITTAVKAVPVKQIGYSGLMVPVLEDKLLARRWAEGTITTDTLLAYSAVCGTGLNTIPYPGGIGINQLARIFGDVASLAWKWKKPLSARLQPVSGKKAGDPTEFSGPYLFNTTLNDLP